MRNWLSAPSLSNSLQLLCMVLIAGAVVRHEFFSQPSIAMPRTSKLSSQQWHQATEAGHWIGSSTAPVVVVLFADFECPACRAFEQGALAAARARYSDRMSVLFRHMPLSYHTYAYAAARASECAAVQGRFPGFVDVMYADQRDLGKRPFVDFARAAGVPDLRTFETCAAASDTISAVEDDVREATALNSTGTPTILVNGIQLLSVPDSAQFDRLIGDALRHPATR